MTIRSQADTSLAIGSIADLNLGRQNCLPPSTQFGARLMEGRRLSYTHVKTIHHPAGGSPAGIRFHSLLLPWHPHLVTGLGLCLLPVPARPLVYRPYYPRLWDSSRALFHPAFPPVHSDHIHARNRHGHGCKRRHIRNGNGRLLHPSCYGCPPDPRAERRGKFPYTLSAPVHAHRSRHEPDRHWRDALRPIP